MSTPCIHDITPGTDYVGFARIHSAEAKVTAAGKPFAAYTLQDRSGSIRTNCWDTPPEQVLPVGSLVKFGGKGELFNDQIQLRLNSNQFRPVEPRDEFSLSDILPCAPERPENMLAEVRETLAAMSDPNIRSLTQALIEEATESILRFPAAQSMHHAEIGGLLHHVTSMLRAAKGITSAYPTLNTDLLYAGIIIHDIGKLEEMACDSLGLVSGYTTPGKLLGHIQLGVLRIGQTARAIGVPNETALLLQHMVLAHHGKPEWGSPMPARFPEAEVLSTLDLLDARLFEMNAALASTDPGTFSDKVQALERRELYRIP